MVSLKILIWHPFNFTHNILPLAIYLQSCTPRIISKNVILNIFVLLFVYILALEKVFISNISSPALYPWPAGLVSPGLYPVANLSVFDGN